MKLLTKPITELILLLGLIIPSLCSAEIHPIVFIDDNDLYNKTAFGMSFSDFKSKAGTYISACQDANRSNQFADKACKVAFKTNDYGMAEALVMFKNEQLISVYHKLNNENYEKLVKNLNDIYKENAQIEKRVEKKGIFSDSLANEYAIWSFSNYLMLASKFDVQKYQKNSPNFLYAMESTNPEFMNNIKDEAKKKSNIEVITKQAPLNLPSNSLVQNTPNTEDNPTSTAVEQPKPIAKKAKIINPNWPQEPDSFMGVNFGESFTSQVNRCPSKSTIIEKNRCYNVISEKAEFYEAHNLADLGMYLLDVWPKVKNGNFEGIEFEINRLQYLQMLELLEAKFGKAHAVKDTVVQNKMGAKFQGKVFMWNGMNASIELKEYGSKIDRASVSVFTKSFMDLLNKEQKNKAQQYKNNL